MDEQFHSIPTIAKRFGVSTQTIRNWLAANKLASVKVGGSVRITESAIQAMIDNGTRVPTGLSREARAAITALVAAAPTLTSDQISRLRVVLADTTVSVAA